MIYKSSCPNNTWTFQNLPVFLFSVFGPPELGLDSRDAGNRHLLGPAERVATVDLLLRLLPQYPALDHQDADGIGVLRDQLLVHLRADENRVNDLLVHWHLELRLLDVDPGLLIVLQHPDAVVGIDLGDVADHLELHLEYP